MAKRTVTGTFLWLLSILLTSAGSAQSLLWIGSMGTPYAEAHGVSSDGTAVAGWAGVSSPHRAFRWTPLTGIEDLGALTPGRDAEAWGMSANGQVVVGWSFVGSGSIYLGSAGKTEKWKPLEPSEDKRVGPTEPLKTEASS
jgi:probable HAF family extracellular repeat protein